MKYAIFLLTILCILTSFQSVDGQVNVVNQSDVEVTISPQNPGPNSSVYVSAVSYVFDINSASVSWLVNGQVVKSGRGEKTFSFTTGSINQTTTLEVLIVTNQGQTLSRTFSIKPVGVDLMWESEGYTPPFYKGKTLFSHQNKITFIAIPHMIGANGSEISPKNLIYKWTKNGQVIENASGFGKNAYVTSGSLISRPVEVKVEVTSPNTDSAGFANTVVTPIEPEIVFYSKNPLYGIEFQKALTNTIDLGNLQEIAIIGIPLFFGTSDATSRNLEYTWAINGAVIAEDLYQRIQVFRPIPGTSGSSRISLGVNSSNKILQSAKNSFDLVFKNTDTVTETGF